jgi:hypothetical protein
MAHWDTSASLKLFLAEADSLVFVALAAGGKQPVTAFIARHEARAAFLRREGEHALPSGETWLSNAAIMLALSSPTLIVVWIVLMPWN